MKLLLLNRVAIISITLSLFFSCASLKSQEENNDQKKSNEIVLNYAHESISTLQKELVETMIKGYENKQLKAINKHVTLDKDPNNQGDAKYIEFDLETLKKFIYHIEMNAKKTDSTILDKDLGIRMYYATYPKFTEWKSYPDLQDPRFLENPLTKQYGLRHTLVMRPIIKKNGKNVLFTSPETNTGSSHQASKTVLSIAALVDAQNHGTIRPPF